MLETFHQFIEILFHVFLFYHQNWGSSERSVLIIGEGGATEAIETYLKTIFFAWLVFIMNENQRITKDKLFRTNHPSLECTPHLTSIRDGGSGTYVAYAYVA